MKQFLAILSMGFILVLFACKNNNTVVNVNPNTVMDSANLTEIQWIDSLVNFGSIPMGETKVVTFKMRNIGKKPLIISNVQAGCGCTIPDYTKGAIAPGEEGFVSGSFDSNKSHPGEVRKSIFVSTNTKNGSNKTLIFTGVILSANEGPGAAKKN